LAALAFLFTDIEESTSKWETDYRAMSRALLQHDRLLSEAVAQEGGRIVKHTGDGVFAALPAKRGLACALEIQRRLARAHWEPFQRFRVRVGVHLGEAEERAGDYFGPVINCAARIMSKAAGGQVLASLEAVRGCTLPIDARTQEAGVFRLKGIDKPQRLCHLLHPDLELREQREIRSDEGARWHLPAAVAPLTGRSLELLEASETFQSADTALFTVVGEPGNGKTRFALELARHLAPRFADGACLVDLSGLDSRDPLGAQVAATFGLNPAYQRDSESVVAEFLAERQVLLVLDPFDHLPSRAIFVARLLQKAPSLRVLATSTWPLGVRDELVWRLPPLSGGLAGDAMQVLAGELSRHGAVVEPAQALALLEALGCNALALRLVGPLVREFGADELLKRLQRAGARARPPEGIGLPLAAAFECAFEALGEADAAVFARLAVFRPGFGADAAGTVAGLTPALAERFERAGLLQADDGRYSLTDPIRRLARVKMEAEAGARFRAGVHHRDYYLNLLKDNAADLNGGPHKSEFIRLLDRDFANLREAWRRGCETEALELLSAASTPLGQYFDFRARNREATELYGLAIERFEGQGRSRALCELFMQRANAVVYFGRADESRHLLGLALEYWRSIGDRIKEATALTHLANVAGASGDFDAQIEHATQALELWSALKDVKGVAWAHTQQASGHLRLGRLKEARSLAGWAMEGYEAQGDLAGRLWAMGVAAEADFIQGDVEAARGTCYRILEQARPMDAHWALASAYMQLATIAELQSSYREARHFLERAKDEYVGLGREAQMAFNLRNLLSQVHVALGHYHDAQALLARNLDPARPPENAQDLGWPMNLLAQLRNLQGEFRLAQEICEQGLSDPRLDSDGGAWFKENLADALQQLGQHPRALALLQESLNTAEQAGRLRSMAWGNNRVGLALLAMNRLGQARDHLQKALDMHGRLGEPQGRVSDELGLARIERLEGDPAKAAVMAESAVHAYVGFAMPRGIAVASLELGACFMAQGQQELAREAYAVSLRQAASVGAWPVALRALVRLAELRAASGMQGPAVQALVGCMQQEACDADNRLLAQGVLSSLLKAMGPAAFAAARERGKALDLRRAAAMLGVAVPDPDPGQGPGQE